MAGPHTAIVLQPPLRFAGWETPALQQAILYRSRYERGQVVSLPEDCLYRWQLSGNDFFKQGCQAATKQRARLLIVKERVEQGGIIYLEQCNAPPEFDTPRLALPLHQRILHILRNRPSRGLLQYLLDSIGVQAHLNGARGAGPRQTVLRNMLEPGTFCETIQLDKQRLRNGREGY